MSESIFITGSMCLTTLIEKAKEGHSAFSKSSKDGKVYFNYAEWINNEPNEFGQHSSVLLSSQKDKKEEEGKTYIGNGKKFENKPVGIRDLPKGEWDSNIPVREKKQTEEKTFIDHKKDDLPF
jgi:hypothetical protein